MRKKWVYSLIFSNLFYFQISWHLEYLQNICVTRSVASHIFFFSFIYMCWKKMTAVLFWNIFPGSPNKFSDKWLEKNLNWCQEWGDVGMLFICSESFCRCRAQCKYHCLCWLYKKMMIKYFKTWKMHTLQKSMYNNAPFLKNQQKKYMDKSKRLLEPKRNFYFLLNQGQLS